MKKTLVEIKARVDGLDVFDEKLRRVANYVGVFHQIDTYFNVNKGRLKLREVEGQEYFQLVYYEREDIKDPKRSSVIIAKVIDPYFIKEILSKVLGIKVIVEKYRKIYMYKGVQIHLDEVKGLGTFIEFELNIDEKRIEEGKNKLYKLMKELGIKRKWLVQVSYSDLLLNK